MAFNEKLPEWHNAGVEPPESKKSEGWQPDDKPPADWFNWLFNRIYKALTEIRNILGGHVDATAPHSGHETPAGATAKASTAETNAKSYTDNHAESKTTHGIGSGYYVAKTSRSDQLPAYADIQGKPSSFPPDKHKNSHASGGSDALSPADIGAETPAGAQAKVDAHGNRTDNPHSVTKSQVGLGSVSNYGVATQSEAETGNANNKYMTPQRTKQAIDALQAVKSVAGKTGVVTLSKSDVGLANVDNVKQASKEEFDAHLADYTLQVPYVVATGTANNYSVTLNPTPNSLVNGLALAVKIPADSTGASTINVNNLGAKTIKKANGANVTNLKAGGIYTLRYDGVNFILQGEGASGNATASDLLLGKTATTDAGEIVGTIPSKAAQTYTPSTTNQVISAGQYLSGAQTIAGSANLVASNIKHGVNIFGVVGTLIEGKQFATGGPVTVSSTEFTINNLDFKPDLVYVAGSNNFAFGTNNVFGSGVWSVDVAQGGALNKRSTFTVSSTGFSIRVPLTGINYSWIAIKI